VAVALATGSLAACGGSSTAGSSGSSGAKVDEVVIGMPSPLTGPGGAYGTPQAAGAQMVVDAINKNGGIKELGGAKLKLIVKDTKTDPTEASKIVRELAAQKVSAFVGPVLSGETLATKPLLEQLQIPAFTGVGDDRATQDNENGMIFRIQYATSVGAKATVEYLKKLLDDGTLPPVHKVGIVISSNPPGPSVTPVLQEGLTKLGIEATVLSYDPAQVKDFAPTVAKLQSEGVDLVMGYQSPPDATLFAQAVGGQSWRPPAGYLWTNSPVFTDALRKSAGDAVTGWVTAAFCQSLDSDYFPKETRDLSAAYEKKYGVTMPGSAATVGGTDVTIIADAIAKAKSADPKKIAAAARTLKFDTPKDSAYPYYMTPGGLDFNKSQDNTAMLIPFIQVTPDGSYDTVAPSEIADGKLQPLS
jgi:branched-chain amino acid transport system substrate-binding protein